MEKFNLKRLREIAHPLTEEQRERHRITMEENKRKFEEWKRKHFNP